MNTYRLPLFLSALFFLFLSAPAVAGDKKESAPPSPLFQKLQNGEDICGLTITAADLVLKGQKERDPFNTAVFALQCRNTCCLLKTDLKPSNDVVKAAKASLDGIVKAQGSFTGTKTNGGPLPITPRYKAMSDLLGQHLGNNLPDCSTLPNS